MKFRTIILFLVVLFSSSFGLPIQAQDAAQAELPSAPSAVQQQSQSQEAPSPAEPPSASTTAETAQQTQVPADPAKPAVAPPASDAAQNQPPKTGTASTSNSP